MNDALPFFSVIITTYNRSGLVGRAIQSLIDQSCTDWEGVIIDDGSTDNTFKVVAPFLSGSSQFYYHPFKKPHGYSDAKNNGMALSSGKYIAFLDSDDEYTEDYLETRKQFLEKHPDISLLHGGVQIIGDAYVPDMYHPGKKIHIDECAVGGTFIIARNLYETFGGFIGMPLGSDADYLSRLQETKFRVATIQHRGYIYHRENINSITNNLLRFGRKEIGKKK